MLNDSQVFWKTVIYRVITLVYSVVFTYLSFKWDEAQPRGNTFWKSVAIGFIGWLVGSVIYYMFEYHYNKNGGDQSVEH